MCINYWIHPTLPNYRHFYSLSHMKGGAGDYLSWVPHMWEGCKAVSPLFSPFSSCFSNMKETKCALSIAFVALLLMSQSFPSSAHQTITKSPNGIQSRNSVAIDSRNLGVQIKRRVRIIPTSAGTASRAKPKSSANRKDKSIFQLCSLLGVSIFFGFFLI